MDELKTLDEAIKYATEVAEENENDAQIWHKRTKNRLVEFCDKAIQEENNCIKRAKEHRQLAEWLKDYKRLLEQEPCEDAISRQAAIKAIMQDVSDRRTHGFNAGATRAANRIKLLPPVTPITVTDFADHCRECGAKYGKLLKQEPCEDCISRQAAQARIKSICDEYRLSYEDGERKAATGGSAYALGHAFDDLPPVTPRPRKGH